MNGKGHTYAEVARRTNRDPRTVERDCGSDEKKEEISKLFEEDKHAFLHLPAKEYSCVRYETLKADTYGFVQVDTKKYSTSPRYAKQKVLVAITYDQVTILSDRYEKIVRHNRIYGNASKSMVWQPYLSLMAIRPTALKYTTFYGQLPERWRSYLNECTVEEKKEALKLLSTLLKEHSLEKATETLEMKPSIPVMPVAEVKSLILCKLIYKLSTLYMLL